jgi:hypothetical protein
VRTGVNPRRIIERAMAAHLKFHSDDGLALFIRTTPDVTGRPLYVYPVSATNSLVALDIAKGWHQMLGIPPSVDWWLLVLREEDQYSANKQ